jgi:hypothetical protein
MVRISGSKINRQPEMVAQRVVPGGGIEPPRDQILGTQYLSCSSIGFWPGFLLVKPAAQGPL